MFPTTKRTPAYLAWKNMLDRCFNPKNKRYHRYGGREITVCEAWLNYDNFFADMGPRPDELSLERRNNDLGYSPSNCYWATRQQQARNRMNTIFVLIGGQRMSLYEATEKFGVNYMRAMRRLKKGIAVELAMIQGILPMEYRRPHAPKQKVPRPCITCGELQPGTREAYSHCRKPRRGAVA